MATSRGPRPQRVATATSAIAGLMLLASLASAAPMSVWPTRETMVHRRLLGGNGPCQYTCGRYALATQQPTTDAQPCVQVKCVGMNKIEVDLSWCKANSTISWICCRGGDCSGFTATDCGGALINEGSGSSLQVGCNAARKIQFDVTPGTTSLDMQIHDGPLSGNNACSGGTGTGANQCCGGGGGCTGDNPAASPSAQPAASPSSLSPASSPSQPASSSASQPAASPSALASASPSALSSPSAPS
ncbi:hypothetical protein HYH03_008659 [Edaphochlamys debaryana]|uniref:Uncharacterized protein n=1 Tax=Edaphochlamys debaryana TaxID=47281 RepID=A0A835Y5R7_9CHLO|nr:hypothetical protein HYH03_008659 [Edaphochlamys debaryana]|eukprot:KAG2492995.1 hypothetical protein HYH03_008659 [Edaphochlamys debaryana]